MTTRWWWEGVTLVLAANSALFGLLGAQAGNWWYAVLAGFAPAVLLVSSVLVRRRAPATATGLAVTGAILAGFTFWMIYPVVLGVVVIAGGLVSGRLGVGDGRTAST